MADVHQPPSSGSDEIEPPTEERRSRRQLLTLAGAAAAGGAALAIGQASPAGATSHPVVAGGSTNAGASLTDLDSSNSLFTFGVYNGSSETSSHGALYAWGGFQNADVKLGGSGRLRQVETTSSATAAPAVNPEYNELVRGAGGAFWASSGITSGATGTRWKRINTLRVDHPNGGGAAFSPFRLIDTRNTDGAITLQGARAQGSTFNLNVAGVAQLPSNTRAVVGHITVVSATGGGFITLWPQGVTRPNVATTNFTAGAVVNNAFTVGLSSGGGMSLFVGGPGGGSITVHVIIDITAYVQ